jgi:glycosyltransferase involved in cell wall biosynthesis
MREVDIIHVHWLLHLSITKTLISISRQKLPVLVDVQGLFLLQEPIPGNLKDYIAIRLGRLHEKIRFRDLIIDGFTLPSETFGKFLISTYGISPEKAYVVPDAIDTDFFDTISGEEFKEHIKELQRLSNKYKLVAYVGSISGYHGFYDLLKAFYIVKRKFYDVMLLLIVPKVDVIKNILEKLNNDYVVLENIPRKLIPRTLRYATVLVLPHRAGTQFDYIPSNKINDYMLAGRPIVAYRTLAVEETLAGYSMYLSVKPNDPVELARGIVKAIELYEKAEPKPTFDRVPTLDDVVKALETVYLALIIRWSCDNHRT